MVSNKPNEGEALVRAVGFADNREKLGDARAIHRRNSGKIDDDAFSAARGSFVIGVDDGSLSEHG